MKPWVLQFDGGAAPNPGIGYCAFILTDPDGVAVEQAWKMEHTATNNEAEYEAVYKGIKYCIDQGYEIDTLMVYGDSMLIIKQLDGSWNIKNSSLRVYHNKIRHLLASSPMTVRFRHIPREVNTRADALTHTIRSTAEAV